MRENRPTGAAILHNRIFGPDAEVASSGHARGFQTALAAALRQALVLALRGSCGAEINGLKEDLNSMIRAVLRGRMSVLKFLIKMHFRKNYINI